MAEFPPNLDDGEMWLPSDMFPSVEDQVPSTKFIPHYNSCYDHPQSIEDLLARRFTALSLLERNQTHRFRTPQPPLQGFREPVRCGSTGSFPGGGFLGLHGGMGVGYGGNGCQDESCWTGTRPVYAYNLKNPVHPQVESLMEARARQHVRFLQNRVMLNRVLPFHRNGFGLGVHNGGGFFRETGGTGVFLPRVARNRQSVRNRQETQFYPQRNFIKRVDVRKQDDGHFHLPPEMELPKDWSY